MEHNHIMEIEDANKNIMRITPLGKFLHRNPSLSFSSKALVKKSVDPVLSLNILAKLSW